MSIIKIHEELLNNETSVNILKEEALKKAHETNLKYNTFVTICDNVNISDSLNNTLSGIPYAAKDLFSTKGILTTGCSNALKDYIPFFDATIISRLKEKGAVLIGKNVCDEFGMGGTCTTGHTGIVHNPWEVNHIAGGSSGGSAASVALGIVPFALGTDTGDSVRKPAAFCGVVGYKPTYGVISRYGILPFASSLDHVGIFTRSVMDAAIVTDCVKGPDGKDMTALPQMADFTPQLNGIVSGKKLFYIKELCDINEYDNPSSSLIQTLNKFKETIEICKSLGITIYEESIDKTLLKAIYPTYMIISCAEATSNLSMYTGIIYGHRGSSNNVFEMMKDYRTKGFSPLIKRRLVIGSYVLQKENQERYYLNACRVRHLIIDEMNNKFKNYDGLILPASGEEAPLIKDALEVIDEQRTILENHLAIGNLGGYPSITIPNGFVNNMPIGINITGNIQDDANILNIALALENGLGFKEQVSGGVNE